MKILLISPKGIETQGVSSKGCFPPLGLLSIATFLKKEKPDLDVSIIDEDASGEINLDDHTKVDIVGIYSTMLTYSHAIRIAEIAKSNNAFVVLGGPHANTRAKQILVNRTCVDAIVTGTGEIPMLQLSRQDPLNSIPSLVYRQGKEIIKNKESNRNSLEIYPPIDFSLIDLKSYWDNWHYAFPKKDFYRPLPTIIQRGCDYKYGNGPCIFCSSFHQDRRRLSPTEYWQQITNLHSSFSVDYIRDNSDDPFRDESYLSALCESKIKTNIPAMLVFSRADTIIKSDVVKNLKTLNVVDVFIGFESGSNEILRNSNKGSTREINLKAAKLLSKFDIGLISSFVLGLPGETIETVMKTVDHIKEIRENANVQRADCTILVPFPGSIAFNKMMSIPNLKLKYANKDILDFEELRKDWILEFTNIEYEKLLEISDSIFSEGIIDLSMRHLKQAENIEII